nr:NUDIX hydrolase [Saccharomonospora saliphila]
MPTVFEVPRRSVLPVTAEHPDGVPPVPERVAEPRDAATVALVRDGAGGGIEVFLQHRVRGMAFAGGMTVFPGGGVDPRDADASVGWVGPPPDEWARRFTCSEPQARALVCAAVRETFEESGVLLAGTDTATVSDTSAYADARRALEAREISLAGFLAGEGLAVRADLLRPWGHWVTPEQESRRYDTRFFVAALPDGQHADGATTEAETAGWQRPAEAIADAEAGRTALLPPTWCTLADLGEFGSVAEALASSREIRRITPRLVVDGDTVRVELA